MNIVRLGIRRGDFRGLGVCGDLAFEVALQTLLLTRFPVSFITLQVQSAAQPKEGRCQFAIAKQSVNDATTLAKYLAGDRYELVQKCSELHTKDLISLGLVLRTVSIVDRK